MSSFLHLRLTRTFVLFIEAQNMMGPIIKGISSRGNKKKVEKS